MWKMAEVRALKATSSLKQHQVKTKHFLFFLFHVFVLLTETVSLLVSFFCSSLFTMFESTKCIYLWQCIFIHLYFYFCTMFFFLFPFVAILYLVCKIFMRHLLLSLQMEDYLGFLKWWQSASLTQRMWTCAELACGPTNKCFTVHLNSQDSIFKKRILSIYIVSHLW